VLGYWVFLGCWLYLGYWMFLGALGVCWATGCSCVFLGVRWATGCSCVFLGVPGCALGYWVFGRAACQIWLTLDVLYCTASIWNLCVIAFDRFTATMYPVWYRVLP